MAAGNAVGGECEGGVPCDSPGQLSEALVQGQQFPKGCEAVADHRRQVAHVVHQQTLHVCPTIL